MIQDELQKLLKEACKGAVIPLLERSQEEGRGDYASNVALIIGKQTKRNPQEVALEIISAIPKQDFLEKVEIAGPGFINFFLSKNYLVGELKEIIKQKEKYGQGVAWKKKKVMVEFTDPNPFKVFHVGHLYPNSVGESLCRLFEAQGALVKRVNYQGDIGLHVAKAIWGMQKNMGKVKNLEQKSLQERAAFLGDAYAAGSKAYEEDAQSKHEIEELNTNIFEQDDTEINDLYQKGRAWSLQYFETIYKVLGTKFDRYYFESEVGKMGMKIVEEGLSNGIFEKSQGAVIFPGEKYGLHSRVFINSKGLPTYEAKELGLAPAKYKDFKYDLSVIVTGNEIVEYFKVLLEALRQINPELREKTMHISHGMVRLAEGKMSSRTGTIIVAEDLLAELKKKIQVFMKESGVPEKERESASEIIAVGAAKYALLRVSLGKDIIFDLDTSISLEGESGPYIQYAYARCQSILRKADTVKKLGSAEFSREEMALLRLLSRFPEVAKEASEKFSPNLLCSFAFDLAKTYNLFYNTHRVLQAESEDLIASRLILTQATAYVIKSSLSLLGIKTLERM